MALQVDVPLNTVIADLDDALRRLLRRELERHGFDGVEIAFDAPAKDWSGKLTVPTVDLFLYDLREATERAEISPSERRGNGRAVVTPPPLHLELTYATTAWTKAVEDEHRLLSQVLAILYSYPRMPADAFARAPAPGSPLSNVETAVGRPREEKADFWTAVGGQYKASIDLVAHVTIESGASFVRGPEVRTQTVRTRLLDAPASTLRELHRAGGRVVDGDGAPVADAWVVLPGAGRWTTTGRDGRFILDRVPAGEHDAVVRARDAQEAQGRIVVPGASEDLVLGAKPTRKRRST